MVKPGIGLEGEQHKTVELWQSWETGRGRRNFQAQRLFSLQISELRSELPTTVKPVQSRAVQVPRLAMLRVSSVPPRRLIVGPIGANARAQWIARARGQRKLLYQVNNA